MAAPSTSAATGIAWYLSRCTSTLSGAVVGCPGGHQQPAGREEPPSRGKGTPALRAQRRHADDPADDTSEHVRMVPDTCDTI